MKITLNFDGSYEDLVANWDKMLDETDFQLAEKDPADGSMPAIKDIEYFKVKVIANGVERKFLVRKKNLYVVAFADGKNDSDKTNYKTFANFTYKTDETRLSKQDITDALKNKKLDDTKSILQRKALFFAIAEAARFECVRQLFNNEGFLSGKEKINTFSVEDRIHNWMQTLKSKAPDCVKIPVIKD